MSKDEPVYGLGTIQDGELSRRNAHILMEQSNLEDFQNVLQSIKGWGVFWDNYSPTQFDGNADDIVFASQVGLAADYYFMYGRSADGVVAQMRRLSGQVPMFPLWTFGYWQSKERYKSSAELLSIVDQYRKLQVPLDGIIQDWQYWGSNYLWNAMDFLSEEFADGASLAERVHQRNAHLMISIWASFGPQTKAFRELNEKNLLFDFQTWPQSGLSHIWPPRLDYPSGLRFTMHSRLKRAASTGKILRHCINMVSMPGGWTQPTPTAFIRQTTTIITRPAHRTARGGRCATLSRL